MVLKRNLSSLSIDLKIKESIKIIKLPYLFINKIVKLLRSNKTEKNEKSSINIPNDQTSDVVKTNSQPILPFKTIKEKIITNKQFKLPPLNYLEKNLNAEKNKKNENIEDRKNSGLLEKILSDFGIEGKIKRISCGPVVTLNEFEPAAGVRVSQIVNLSDDIARYTSSVSTRIATLPGKNTVGIEIPNSKRENVFLSEIISDEKFKKQEIHRVLLL